MLLRIHDPGNTFPGPQFPGPETGLLTKVLWKVGSDLDFWGLQRTVQGSGSKEPPLQSFPFELSQLVINQLISVPYIHAPEFLPVSDKWYPP